MFKPSEWVIVFDLDDTLYKEMDFVNSAYAELVKTVLEACQIDLSSKLIKWKSEGANNLLDKIYEHPGVAEKYEKRDLLKIYREHKPSISLNVETRDLINDLESAGAKIGIITDGRSSTQRNKIRALGLDHIDDILISEETTFSKPSSENYQHFQKKFPNKKYAYIADNLSKDFVSPNLMNWSTIGVRDDGRNIHPQGDIESWPVANRPRHWISSLPEIKNVLAND